MDPTVCDLLQKALIEQHFGEQVCDAPLELLIHMAQRFKSLGNTAVRRKQFQGQRSSLHNNCLQAVLDRSYRNQQRLCLQKLSSATARP